ncbi:unnamed protein product, partial [Amoebophrya sp. A25]|eukprot:GSA25T00007308001.1
MERLSASAVRPSAESRIENAMKHLENPFLVETRADLSHAKAPRPSSIMKMDAAFVANRQKLYNKDGQDPNIFDPLERKLDPRTAQEERDFLTNAANALLLGQTFPVVNEAGTKLQREMNKIEDGVVTRMADFLEAQRTKWTEEKMTLHQQLDSYKTTAQTALQSLQAYQQRMKDLENLKEGRARSESLAKELKLKLDELTLEHDDLSLIVRRHQDDENPHLTEIKEELLIVRDEHWLKLAEVRQKIDAEKQDLSTAMQAMKEERRRIIEQNDANIFKQSDVIYRLDVELAKAIGEIGFLVDENRVLAQQNYRLRIKVANAGLRLPPDFFAVIRKTD